MNASDKAFILLALYILILLACLLQLLYIQGMNYRKKIIEKYEREKGNVNK